MASIGILVFLVVGDEDNCGGGGGGDGRVMRERSEMEGREGSRLDNSLTRKRRSSSTARRRPRPESNHVVDVEQQQQQQQQRDGYSSKLKLKIGGIRRSVPAKPSPDMSHSRSLPVKPPRPGDSQQWQKHSSQAEGVKDSSRLASSRDKKTKKEKSIDDALTPEQPAKVHREPSSDPVRKSRRIAKKSILDSKKDKLSDAEMLAKKAEAAQRRKMQVEKATKESEAEAIRKILGLDSEKKKEERKQKEREDKERAARAQTIPENTIRWVMGPKGTVVSFPEEVGLPSIFNSKPCNYPPPREKCAGPSCTNAYRYRDSKLNLPLCSLKCYKAVNGNA
uniref:INO80 complex subunit B-like conserved region domain-containing protein n=1 Tax=Oryza meridionalis TaxID=40149 RepID=A0A0E0CHQ0_9ORYZ